MSELDGYLNREWNTLDNNDYVPEPTKVQKIVSSLASSLKSFVSHVTALLSNAYFFISSALKDWRILLVVCAFAFSGYLIITHDYVIERNPTGNERYSTETISCTHYDYCFACDSINSEGELTCGFRYGVCSGSQKATLKYTEFRHTRKSGKQELSERSDIIKRLTDCG